MLPLRTQKKVKLRKNIFIIAMLALPIAHFLIFYVWLNFNSIIMAFQEGYVMDWSMGFPVQTGRIRYGFGNFAAIFRDQGKILSVALKNTLYYFAANLLIVLPLSLFVSYFLYKGLKGYKFFRFVFFLPSIVSGVIYVTSFSEIIGMYGPLHNLMTFLGMDWQNFLSNPETATSTIIFYTIWTGLGVNMLLFQSAMSRIPDEIMQVAKLDGVGWVRELFQLVIPLIWPTVSMTLLLALTGIFTGGSIVLLFATQGGGSGLIDTIYYWIFAKTNNEGASTLLGDAAAVGLFFTLLSVPILGVGRWLLNKLDPEVSY